MKTWRNIVIIVSAMLFGLWFGFQINRYQEIKVNMEIAELLIDKERNYFMECYKHIENPDYDRVQYRLQYLQRCFNRRGTGYKISL